MPCPAKAMPALGCHWHTREVATHHQQRRRGCRGPGARHRAVSASRQASALASELQSQQVGLLPSPGCRHLGLAQRERGTGGRSLLWCITRHKSLPPLWAQVFREVHCNNHTGKLVLVLNFSFPPFSWVLDTGRNITGWIIRWVSSQFLDGIEIRLMGVPQASNRGREEKAVTGGD